MERQKIVFIQRKYYMVTFMPQGIKLVIHNVYFALAN
jgi:hypothetical protein